MKRISESILKWHCIPLILHYLHLVYLYIYLCVCVCVCKYIYIYIYYVYSSVLPILKMCMYVYIYIYIYIYIHIFKIGSTLLVQLSTLLFHKGIGSFSMTIKIMLKISSYKHHHI